MANTNDATESPTQLRIAAANLNRQARSLERLANMQSTPDSIAQLLADANQLRDEAAKLEHAAMQLEAKKT